MFRICFVAMLIAMGVCPAHALETPKTPTQQGTITGRLMIKGNGPAANAGVMFFDTTVGPPPLPDKYWRVSDVRTGTDADGNFKVNLPPGTYYLGVTRHASGKWIGPPEDGELFLPSPDALGVHKKYTVKVGEVTDIGTLAEVVPFRRAEHVSKGPITAVEGTIVDEFGKPVENVLVFAVAKKDVAAKPLFVSDRSGKDGKFLLKVDKGGTYFLKARSAYGGGKPKPNEVLGMYGTKGAPVPVTVETGKTVSGLVLGSFKYVERNPQNKKQ